MTQSSSSSERQARLRAADDALRSLRETYRQQKRELKEQRRAIRHSWTEEDLQVREARRAARSARREQRRILSEPPVRSLLEEIGCSVTHGAGAALSIVALVLLLLSAKNGVAVFSACVYGGCLVLMFLMSCLYHAFHAGSTVKRIWRRFDYCSIYLLIGGTITPIQLLFVGGTLGTALCVAMWVLIAVGLTFVGVFGPMVARGLHFALFFTIGWSAVIFMPRIWTEARGMFWLVLLGGIVYTVGMIPFAKKVPWAHLIWHFFVLAGALLQWLGIWQYVF